MEVLLAADLLHVTEVHAEAQLLVAALVVVGADAVVVRRGLRRLSRTLMQRWKVCISDADHFPSRKEWKAHDVLIFCTDYAKGAAADGSAAPAAPAA